MIFRCKSCGNVGAMKHVGLLRVCDSCGSYKLKLVEAKKK
jgi:predicted  nucleic acid-binding Zn-ribbon protein